MSSTRRYVAARWTGVKPSPEAVAARAERTAADYDGTVVEVSPLRVGRTRHRTPYWDAVITVEGKP